MQLIRSNLLLHRRHYQAMPLDKAFSFERGTHDGGFKMAAISRHGYPRIRDTRLDQLFDFTGFHITAPA